MNFLTKRTGIQLPRFNVGKRVVVIGAKGFIGTALSKHLEDLGSTVLQISREDVDLLNEESVKRLKQILTPFDKVVYISSIAPAKSVDDVQKNIKMAECFCKSIENLPLKQVVLISSDSVYGESEGNFSEDSPCNPNTYHGLAQLSREIIFKNSKQPNLAILRICGVYGQGDTHNSYGPNRFVRQILNNESINLFGLGLNMRDHIYISDVTEIIINVLMIDFKGSLNVGSGKATSFADVAYNCKKIFHSPNEITMSGDEGIIIRKQSSIIKLESVFPNLSTLDLTAGLADWSNRL